MEIKAKTLTQRAQRGKTSFAKVRWLKGSSGRARALSEAGPSTAYRAFARYFAQDDKFIGDELLTIPLMPR